MLSTRHAAQAQGTTLAQRPAARDVQARWKNIHPSCTFRECLLGVHLAGDAVWESAWALDHPPLLPPPSQPCTLRRCPLDFLGCWRGKSLPSSSQPNRHRTSQFQLHPHRAAAARSSCSRHILTLHARMAPRGLRRTRVAAASTDPWGPSPGLARPRVPPPTLTRPQAEGRSPCPPPPPARGPSPVPAQPPWEPPPPLACRRCPRSTPS